MAVFHVNGPNGEVYEVTAPDNATQAQVVAFARQQHAGGKAKPNVAKDVGKSYVSGLGQSVSAFADDFLKYTNPAQVAHDLGQKAADVGGWLVGKPAVQVPQFSPSFSAAASRNAYQPQTTAGEAALTFGQMTPNALAPGSAPARVANVVVPAVVSETAGQVARRSGASPQVEQGVRIAGGLAGAGVSSVRLAPGRARTPVSNLPRQDVAAVNARVAEYRAANIEPTLVDVVDDSGRGAVRAAASRMTPGRQRATDFRDARALDIPSRMSGQARRVMSQDPRTPDQIRGEMAAQRTTNANQAFGAVRGDVIPAPPEAIQAMQTHYGRAAVVEAARRERDPQVRAALQQLSQSLDNPNGVQMSIGMADRISRVLLSRGQAAARNGDNDLAATFSQLGNDVRNPARNASTGYRAALDGYAADSRLQEAAGVGENMLTRNTDEFVQQAQGLGYDERNLALAAGRRAIERKAGENPASAPGVARQIADAPEQQARNAALLGPRRAVQLQNGMRLEEQLVRNANDIAPRIGSQTQNKAQDAAQMASGVVNVGRQAARGDWLGIGIDWLRSRGMNDAQAEQLVHISTDPAQLGRAVQMITARYGPQAGRQFLQLRNAAITGALATSSQSAASPQPQP